MGLGNPGAEYRYTRHNVGFRVVAALASELGTKLGAGRGDFVTGRATLAGEDIVLVLPLTYMNRSGHAVRTVLDQLSIAPPDLLVICDDVQLPLGRLRVRRAGGAGGNNGLASIIESLGTEGFARLRAGIGTEKPSEDRVDHVLIPFCDHERPAAEEMIREAAAAVRMIITDGIDAAMNEINRKAQLEKDVS